MQDNSQQNIPSRPVGYHARPFVLHTRVVTGTGGGPEKTILNSPRFLAKRGVDSACLFMRPPADPGFDALQQKGNDCGAEVIAIDDSGPFDLNVVRQCLRVCRERDVKIWHAHDYKSNAMGLLLRRFHPMHLVTTAHGWVRYTSRTPLYYRIDRFCMKRYDRVICVSPDLVEQCIESGINSERISLIDNAIVADDYGQTPPTASQKAAFGFTDNRLVVAAVGRLSEEKGFSELIRTIKRLDDEQFPIGLIIAGEGGLRQSLQQQIDDLQLQDRVKLAGFVADPRRVYQAADIFVLSSLREGLPNVVLEAMASKRAVVTTNVNGIPRLVRHGINGLIVDNNSPESLHEGIRRLIVDESKRHTLAAAGRRTIETNFSFKNRIEQVVAVYRSLSGELAVSLQPKSHERTPASGVKLPEPVPVLTSAE